MGVALVEVGQLGALFETVKGTANAPAALDAGIRVWDIGLEEKVEMHERNPVEAEFDQPHAIPGMRSYQLTFRAEIVGGTSAGSRPPVWQLLQACSLTEAISAGVSVTYSPLTPEASQKTVTIDVYRRVAGAVKRHRLTGAMGNVRIVCLSDGVPYMEFTFLGVYNEPVDVADLLTTPPYVMAGPPPVVGATVSLMSQTLRCVGFEIDLGNKVELREDVNQPSGYVHAVVVDRLPTISVAPEDELAATVEWLAKKTTPTVGEFIGLIGSAAGNIFRVRAPAAQVMEAGWGTRGTRITRTLSLAARKLANAGADSLTIRWT